MNHLGECRPQPRYIERGGEIAYRQPFRSAGARIHFFFVEADQDYLAAYLDRCFNRPSGGVVSLRPPGPYVVLNFIHVERLTSGPPDSALGGAAEDEASIWLPALEPRRGSRLVWTVPYMFVDSGQALVSGREVYGYPKQLATFRTRFLDDGTPDRLSLRTLALKKHKPKALAKPRRVVRVSRVGPHRPGEPRTHSDLRRATERLEAFFPDRTEVVRYIEQIWEAGAESRNPAPGTESPEEQAQNRTDLAELTLRLWQDLFDCNLNMVLLKQFRSARDPQRACYQAMLEIPHKLAEMREWVLHGDQFDVEFASLASQHIQEELGVSREKQRVAMAVTVDFDFEVDRAKVLWQASTD